MPVQTQERYLKQKIGSPYQIWGFEKPCSALPVHKTLRIEVMAEAVIHWSDDDWNTTKQTTTKDTGLGLYVADLSTINKKSKHITFPFFWKEANRWENKNFSVSIESTTKNL